MHIEKYLNEDGKVVMTEDEFNEMVDENNCMKAQIEELKTELKKSKGCRERPSSSSGQIRSDSQGVKRIGAVLTV